MVYIPYNTPVSSCLDTFVLLDEDVVAQFYLQFIPKYQRERETEYVDIGQKNPSLLLLVIL